MTSPEIYERLQSLTKESGIASALEFLSGHFREQKQPHQLFEILKMKSRHELGLPLLYGQDSETLSEEQQKNLEDGLLAACREVGIALIENGDYQQGWMYLQPVGDRNLVIELFSKIEATEENTEELIEVTLSQGAAPEIGYALLMKQFGTCNAITTFDTQLVQLEKPLRKRLAAQLVTHLYQELVENIANHVEEKEGQRPGETSLSALKANRAWLTEGGGHHVDTTHLASVMRIGQIVDDPEALRMLLEMARYGSGLASDFHYEGYPPFKETYLSHQLFYQALLGENVDEAIRYFDEQAKTIDRNQHGSAAVETLIDLLARVGRNEQAIDVSTELLLGQGETIGVAPGVFEIASNQSELKQLMDYYREKDDLLGYAIGLLRTQTL